MELREACEKAARYWLGWTLDPNYKWFRDHDDTLIYFPRKDCATEFMEKQNIDRLASPWGRDLLLRAAEERGWDWNAYRAFRRYHYHLFHDKHGGVNGPQMENEYHAVAFAFARAADAIEKETA